MAPNLSCQTQTKMIVQPSSNVAKFEETPFSVEKTSRIMRCSSVSLSEEEEQSVVVDRAEYVRSFASRSWKKTSFTIRNSYTFADACNLEWCPGVSSGLDEDERQSNVKQRVAIEPEEKKAKEAVENDDKSVSFIWHKKLDAFPPDDEKKYTIEIKKKEEIEIKDVKAETKTKEKCGLNLLTIPYSIQETSCGPEDVLSIEPPSTSSESLEVQDVISTKDETSTDDYAEVKVEEVQLPEKETKPKTVLRRHAVRKVKRSVWCITEPDPPVVQRKQTRKTHKTVKTRKPRQQRKHAPKQSFSVFDEADDSITIHSIKPAPSKRKRANSPVRNEPRDSGVHSEGSSSGSNDGCSGSSGSSSGNSAGGDSGGGGFGGQGNADGDEGDKKKFPQWYFPLPQKADTRDRKKKKRSKEEEEDDGSQEKMEVDSPTTKPSGFEMFLPSKVDNAEQCHSPGEETPHTTTTGKLQSCFVFFPQDLQHACYCSSHICRQNLKCKDVKSEVEHMKAHKEWNLCGRCVNTRNVVKQHAICCRRPGCRVPDCQSLRSCNTNNGQPVPAKARKVSPPSPQLYDWTPPIAAFSALLTASRIDGKVIFRNSTLLPEDYFSEHIDYNVMRKNKLGSGSNGDIYSICMQSDMNKKMAMKETRYVIPREEVDVYKVLGEHPHIVTHYGGTARGSRGGANIFMEKCEQSLFHYMETLQRRLTVEEAIFYWLQVLDAVNYLHNLPVPVIHKDIKAKNVLLTAEGSRAKLADFDSAKRLTHELTEAGLKPLGTRGFAAPEVLEEKPHGRAADIYNLACFLIELTVGVPTKDLLQEQINELRELNPDLGQLVYECVKYNPEERPTARSLLQWPVIQRYRAGERF